MKLILRPEDFPPTFGYKLASEAAEVANAHLKEMLSELELLRKADDREIARLNKQLKSARVVIKRCAECLSPGSVRWLEEKYGKSWLRLKRCSSENPSPRR